MTPLAAISTQLARPICAGPIAIPVSLMIHCMGPSAVTIFRCFRAFASSCAIALCTLFTILSLKTWGSVLLLGCKGENSKRGDASLMAYLSVVPFATYASDELELAQRIGSHLRRRDIIQIEHLTLRIVSLASHRLEVVSMKKARTRFTAS